MKTLTQHVEHIKAKPHHVRKRVAFTAATVVAGSIGLVWLVGSLSMGLFAIKSTSFADTTSGESVIVTSDQAPSSANLAGAASAFQNNDAPARIQIVDTTPATTSPNKAEQTVIPF